MEASVDGGPVPARGVRSKHRWDCRKRSWTGPTGPAARARAARQPSDSSEPFRGCKRGIREHVAPGTCLRPYVRVSVANRIPPKLGPLRKKSGFSWPLTFRTSTRPERMCGARRLNTPAKTFRGRCPWIRSAAPLHTAWLSVPKQKRSQTTPAARRTA